MRGEPLWFGIVCLAENPAKVVTARIAFYA
jgi:hypothetical protein